MVCTSLSTELALLALFFGEKVIAAAWINHLDSETPLIRPGTGESRGEDFLGLFRVKGKA